jgi:hypothetical protein
VRAVRLLVQADTTLVRGFEFDLVTHHCGEGDPSRTEQDHETHQGWRIRESSPRIWTV